MAKNQLQTAIDGVSKGGTLTLDRNRWPGEIEGPIRITKPITIEGQGQIVHASSSPVILIAASDVHLKNLEIMAHRGGAGSQSIAVEFEARTRGFFRRRKDAPPLFENIVLQGDVKGVDSEAGSWVLPKHSLKLNALAPDVEHRFRLVIQVPVPCRLVPQVDRLQLSRTDLSAGEHEIELTLGSNDFFDGNYLDGFVHVETDLFRRRFRVTGRFDAARGAKVSPTEPLFTPPKPPPTPKPEPSTKSEPVPPSVPTPSTPVPSAPDAGSPPEPQAAPPAVPPSSAPTGDDVVPAPPPSERVPPEHIRSSPGAAFEGDDPGEAQTPDSRSRSSRRKQEVIPIGDLFAAPTDQRDLGSTLAGGSTSDENVPASRDSEKKTLDDLVTKVDGGDLWGISNPNSPKSGGSSRRPPKDASAAANESTPPKQPTKPKREPARKRDDSDRIGDAFLS